MFFSRWKDYDPGWLVELAREQFPDDLALHEALLKCNKILNGAYFVNPARPNKKGSEWQFARSITLEDPEKGEVVLDILKDGRVGSIEMLSLTLSSK